MTPLFRTATTSTQIPLSSPETQQMLVHIPHLAMFISLHEHFALNSKAKYVLVAKLTPLPPSSVEVKNEWCMSPFRHTPAQRYEVLYPYF